MAYKHPILRLADRDILWAYRHWACSHPSCYRTPSTIHRRNYRRIRYGSHLQGLGRAYAPSPDEGQYKGDFYRDTQHMNAAGNYSKNPSLYSDTRFKTPTSPTPTQATRDSSTSQEQYQPVSATVSNQLRNPHQTLSLTFTLGLLSSLVFLASRNCGGRSVESSGQLHGSLAHSLN